MIILDDSLVVFNDFTLLTYDADRRPACTNKNTPSLHFPGYIRIATGMFRILIMNTVELGFASMDGE